MVQVLQRSPSFGEQIGGAIGQGLGKGLSEGADRYRQKKLLSEENAAIKKEYGIDLSGITDPNTRQIVLADSLKLGRRRQEADASMNTDYGFGNGNVSDLAKGLTSSGKISNAQNKPYKGNIDELETALEPEMALKERASSKKSKAKNKENIKISGNMPRESLSEEIFDEMNPEQVDALARSIAEQRSSQGLPTSYEEAYQLAAHKNKEIRDHNDYVRKQQTDRAIRQRDYGTKGKEKILNVLPDATDEISSIFQKLGEEASLKYDSEADIDKYLSKEATKFKNDIFNIRKSLPSPTVFSDIMKKAQGNERSQDKNISDMRIKLSSLLNKGLYDTARKELSKLGYSPEDREMIISNLGEGAKKSVAQMPDFKRIPNNKLGGMVISPRETPSIEKPLNDEEKNIFKENLQSALKNDPSSNLILLRKAYADKGVDWSTFRDGIYELLSIPPEEGGISLDNDQFNALNSTLYEPPISPLGKILKFLRLE